MVYVPVAPSGEHHAPGYTREAPVDEPVVVVVVVDVDAGAGVPATGVVVDVDETDDCPTRVVDGDGLVVDVLVVGAANPAPDGTSGHAAIVKLAHDDVSKFFTLPHSLWSIDRPQRAFTAIQLPRYVQR